MPRCPRKPSKTGIYHIMLRGNERKEIFIDDEDRKRIIDTLVQMKKDRKYYLYSYCVMDNHIHLVLKEGEDPVARAVKRIAVSYAYYFNKKYKRVGHIFQDRYRSENIEDEGYLLSAIRYVHKNPESAGICSATEYKWSSMSLYLNIHRYIKQFPEFQEVLSMFSNQTDKAVELFMEFNNRVKDDMTFVDMEEDEPSEINEDNVQDFIDEYLKGRGLMLDEINKRGNASIRAGLVKELQKRSNLSLRKIADIMGINRETVRRICVSKEPSP